MADDQQVKDEEQQETADERQEDEEQEETADERQDGDGGGGGAASEAQQAAQESAQEREEAEQEMHELEEKDDLPRDLEDWPDGKAKYITFGGQEGESGYDEGATKKLGPSSLRRHEDGDISIEGEKVDNPDDYKGEPIPGGPTDPNTADLPGEARVKEKQERHRKERQKEAQESREQEGREKQESGEKDD